MPPWICPVNKSQMWRAHWGVLKPKRYRRPTKTSIPHLNYYNISLMAKADRVSTQSMLKAKYMDEMMSVRYYGAYGHVYVVSECGDERRSWENNVGYRCVCIEGIHGCGPLYLQCRVIIALFLERKTRYLLTKLSSNVQTRLAHSLTIFAGCPLSAKSTSIPSHQHLR